MNNSKKPLYGLLTGNDPPTSEFSIWKNKNGVFSCLKCKFKSKSYKQVKMHYDSKHPTYF